MHSDSTTSTKTCIKCGRTKLLSEFHRNKANKDYRHSRCKECRKEERRVRYTAESEKAKEDARAWRENNPERKRQTDAAWYAANKEHASETSRAWRKNNLEHKRKYDAAYYDANTERIKKNVRAWQKANPDKVRESSRKTSLRQRAKHPDRIKARAAVGRSVRLGKFPVASTQFCALCGTPAQEYHHHLGYAEKHKLDVIPLCKTCHRRKHGKN